MPRTTKQIIEQADELATAFKQHQPDPTAIKSAASLRVVREAFKVWVEAERHLAEAVAVARAEAHSWASIGAMVGTSGEAACGRYGDVPSAR